ncbi:tryptophan--tRNA ligase [Alkalibacter saccharofermentans]|uniref:Tryptophan--tRNA ligase n=1 Tax=Alkalibacter saccharofermentans DSM 14828 TaxID=1120975 RepID=A0A1M4YB94_9FIRM|nr:tryptophan--tRNA ligase [Alkalibacter saccharofermentans]SHF02853.1 tryptophanyl-tRNA synthetase [Alkalibacter saccharofermentans DSM 14828]
MESQKKTLYSGIQPSGSFTIGNYFGAIKNWVDLQEDYSCYFCVVDLHALTVPQVPKDLRKNSYESFITLLAAGLDPEKVAIYFQSHVSAHAELAWILNCYSYMGELGRMTQFKDKSQKQGENIRVGLYGYPVLMASDILLYQTDLVPVGEDQKQHLELTRDIANRFNNLYSPTFKVPDPYIGEKGARIMSLQEPSKKMSKSDENSNSFITLRDSKDIIIKKFKRAVTDSDSQVRFDRVEKPGVSNLMEIYSCATDKDFSEIEREFEGKGYGDFKIAVGEAVADSLQPIQKRFEMLSEDKAYVEEIIKKSTEKTQRAAFKTLSKVKKKVGLYSL